MNASPHQSSVRRKSISSTANLALASAPATVERVRVITLKLRLGRGSRIRVLTGMLLFATGAAQASQPQKFLTFDHAMSAAEIAAHPDEYVFVWGATNSALTKAFNEHSPKTLLSTYYPYSRDPDASHGIGFWKASHPDWIAYACDGKTPIALYGDRNVTLDIARLDVVDWQIANFLKRPAGIDAVALDNFQFHNDGNICGSLNSTGKFVKRYGGGPRDMAYAEDAVRWLEKVSTVLHAHRVKVVINHVPDLSSEGDDPDSPLVQGMVGAVDGILDEHAQNAMRDPHKAALLTRFVDYANAKGKWVYLLYQLDHLDRDAVESAMANYLTIAGPMTAVYVSQRDSTYGQEPDFLGLDKDVGDPCGSAVTVRGVISRTYSRGLAIFAETGQPLTSVPIPTGYRNVDGRDAGVSVEIAGGHGRVLYTSQANACAKHG